MKYQSIDEWIYPEIDYYEMIDKFRWTEGDMDKFTSSSSFPKNFLSLIFLSKNWKRDVDGNLVISDQQIFQFYNKQFNNELAKILKKMQPKLILEVGAGNGALSRLISNRGFNIVATDNYSWPFAKKYYKIEKMGYKKALKKYVPDVVLVSWMLLNSDWTPEFRNTKSVKHYIQIGELNGCCGGDTKDRKAWPFQIAKSASKFALCRTDTLCWDVNNLRDDFMMYHSYVGVTSRRKFAFKL